MIGRALLPADRSAGRRGPSIAGAGIGLRICHIEALLQHRPSVPWLELLADNHLAEGGLTAAQVEAVAALYPLTVHCVGMNLAGSDPLDRTYVARVRDLQARTGAAWVSDHLCFTAEGGRYYHELLPFPYTDEALRHLAARVAQVQDWLGEPILVENLSAYLRFADTPMSEAQFLAELCRATDCRILLDVNNLYVNQVNHGEDPDAYLAALPLERVGEVHLAGYAERPGYLLDAHNNPVSAPVWALYRRVCRRLPGVATLIEWDDDIPDLDILVREAARAEAIAGAEAGAPVPLGLSA